MEENFNNNVQPTMQGANNQGPQSQGPQQGPNGENKSKAGKIVLIVLGVIVAIILVLQIVAMASGHGNVINMIQDWTKPKAVTETNTSKNTTQTNSTNVNTTNTTESKIRENAEKIKEGVEGIAEEVGSKVKEKSEKIGENTQQKAEEIKEKVQEGIGKIKETVEQGIEKVENKIDETKTKMEVRRLFTEKLKTDNENNTEKLVDYRIDEVKILTEEERQGGMAEEYLKTDILAYVTYSVKPKDINTTGWIAGNGQVSGDWIINKTACVCVRDGKIQFSGTGW